MLHYFYWYFSVAFCENYEETPFCFYYFSEKQPHAQVWFGLGRQTQILIGSKFGANVLYSATPYEYYPRRMRICSKEAHQHRGTQQTQKSDFLFVRPNSN